MPTNVITPFAFGENLLRTTTDEHGNPWFVAKDVAITLGYEWNGSKNIQHVPEEWRGVETVSTPSGTQEMLTLSEQGLYFFLGRSDKPKALPYQKWIAGDVLPTLRRTGSYTMPTASRQSACISFPMPALPQEALTLRKALRQRLWQDALQTARLDGGNSDDAVRWFHYLCRMTAAEPTGPESVQTEVNRFYHECCTKTDGADTRFAVLYDAFRKWRCGKGHMPSQKAFGEALNALTGKRRSNGSVYSDISLRSTL